MIVLLWRGFKHHMLQKKKCILIRPPSVSSDKKFSKAEVLEIKKIANLHTYRKSHQKDKGI